MKAVILAGGFGTRLRPLSCTRPKILFPIVNKPLIEWTFERLAKNNVKEAIMAINFQTEVAIKQYKPSRHGLKITYSRDPPKKPLGTGGPIKKAEKRIGHDAPFLVLNGDIFADVNYTGLLKLHERKKATATIALHHAKDPSRYGVAVLAKDGCIERFVEKPKRKEAPSTLINAGAYILSPEIFKRIPKNRLVSLEREVFTKLAEEGRLYGHVYKGLWRDIGTPEDYLEINKILIDSTPLQKLDKGTEVKSPVAFDKHVHIGQGSIIGPNVVLGRNVKIGNNVRIRDSVVLPDAVLEDNASVKGAIIGEGAHIGEKAKIEKGCIISDHAKIGDRVILTEHVSICPAKEISENVLTPKNIC